MDFEVGTIHTGKVTGITKFGAFVTIAPGKTGLVHISEITTAFVSDVHEHLAEGQEVTVKIIGSDDSGRIKLSIKAVDAPTGEKPPPQPRPPRQQGAPRESGDAAFEDKLKRFMQDSDSKMSGIKQYSDKKGARRRGK
jgi:S1 RNA binding domain protein